MATRDDVGALRRRRPESVAVSAALSQAGFDSTLASRVIVHPIRLSGNEVPFLSDLLKDRLTWEVCVDVTESRAASLPEWMNTIAILLDPLEGGIMKITVERSSTDPIQWSLKARSRVEDVLASRVDEAITGIARPLKYSWVHAVSCASDVAGAQRVVSYYVLYRDARSNHPLPMWLIESYGLPPRPSPRPIPLPVNGDGDVAHEDKPKNAAEAWRTAVCAETGVELWHDNLPTLWQDD